VFDKGDRVTPSSMLRLVRLLGFTVCVVDVLFVCVDESDKILTE
jgi:hypothetical protein